MNAIFITVRTSSTRLPKKCLLEIDGVKNITRLIRNVKKSEEADVIILCTTNNKDDDILCEIATEEGIQYFRGSEHDKLERWRGAAEKYNVDVVVTADGDDLFCDPILIDMGFNQILKNGCHFIEEKPGYSVPIGAFTYAFTVNALNKVCEIKDSSDTEMMSVYFTETGLFYVETLENIPKELNRPEIRMTLDYEDDLKFFTNIIENINLTDYTLYDIIKYINKNPEVIKLNQYLTEEFLQNQKRKTKLKIK